MNKEITTNKSIELCNPTKNPELTSSIFNDGEHKLKGNASNK
jgi:hypothetical protein